MERQKGLEELLDLGGPGGVMIAAGEMEGEGSRFLKPSGSQAEEVSTTDAQKLGSRVRVDVAEVERIERLVEEL